MINTSMGIVIVILAMISAALLLQKTKFGRSVGAPLIIIIIGIILMNTGIVPAWHDTYSVFLQYAVPLSMAILLMNVDFKQLRVLSKEPALAMGSAVLCVSLVAIIFGIVFSSFVPESWKMAGMFVGTYTGGSANLTAIAYGLNATSETIAAANASDYVIGMPLMLILFALPNIMNKSAKFNRIWPYHMTDEQRLAVPGGEGGKRLFDAKEISICDIAVLLCLAFGINAFSTWLSTTLFDVNFANSGKILILSTVSVLLGQVPFIKRLKGKLDIGIFIAMFYFCVIGFLIDFNSFLGSALPSTLLCLCIILGSLILHTLVMRLMKIKYEYAIVSITAGIAEGTSAAMVASNGGWMSIVSVGVMLGAVGAVLGNYCGIGVAYLVRFITGG